MELSSKLVKLFLKFIEESKGIDSFEISGSMCQCVDGDSNSVIIDQEWDSIEGISTKGSRLVIKFKDLRANITIWEYDNIIDKCDKKVREFEEIEKEKELKRQEKLVDRLLDN